MCVSQLFFSCAEEWTVPKVCWKQTRPTRLTWFFCNSFCTWRCTPIRRVDDCTVVDSTRILGWSCSGPIWQDSSITVIKLFQLFAGGGEWGWRHYILPVSHSKSSTASLKWYTCLTVLLGSSWSQGTLRMGKSSCTSLPQMLTRP